MITVIDTQYTRMPNSINNHTIKLFVWNGHMLSMDKETDISPIAYRLYEVGNGMLLDYFCDGMNWKSAMLFVEGWLTATYGKQTGEK